MADLINYKVMQASVKDGVVGLPKGAVPMGIGVDPEAEDTIIVFLMQYNSWAAQYPEQLKAELATKRESKKDGN